MAGQFKPCEGGCTCRYVRYRVNFEPLIVHCCHCSWCQRQFGAAFAVNALIEADHVELLSGEVEEMMIPSPSGKGQLMARCPKCKVTVWSNYYMGGMREYIRFIRVGSLDNPELISPDVHIFTSSKLPWVVLPPDDLFVDVFYDLDETWSPESLRRLDAIDAAAGTGNTWRNQRRSKE